MLLLLVASSERLTATGAAEIVGHFTATISGALCLGGLVFTLITAIPEDRGVLDPASYRGHLLVERAAPLWLVSSAVMVVVQAAADAGVPLTRVLGSGHLGSAVGASETARAWVTVVIFAAILTVTTRLTVRWEWHAVMLIPAIVGVVAVPVTGNAGQGADHDYATSSVIVFAIALAVLTGLKVAAATLPVADGMRHRCRVVAAAGGAVALLYGLLLLILLAGSGLFSSGYGRLGLLAGAALLIGWIIDLRGHSSRALAVTSALSATVAVAATSAMAVHTAPRLLASRPTVWDVLLGYRLPGPPTIGQLLSFWRFDTFLGGLAIALGAAYVIGVIRLRRRGDAWPTGRLVAWLAGCAALLTATSSGVRAYGSAMFSIHMVEHMTLNMFAPVLLVLGAPATLALRVLPASGSAHPGPREWLLRFIHSPFTRFLSNPVTAFVLFVGSLYAVYFTPLFDTLVRYHWGHEFMGLHFLITGYLFYWGIIGIDPGPRRLPFIGRLGLLFAIMPFHAFFGIAMMTSDSVVGGNFYRGLALPWVPSLTDDQHLGGAIAWGSSELPVLVVVVALIAQWARQDRRDATRGDRHASAAYGGDDELAAYNQMLQELARNRR
ncbi:MAG: cytochrome c oxidase assembly protein [Mycobacterium sp.]|nr:cytochrome c oxidase assembly protein [Mycobacterium sp.]